MKTKPKDDGVMLFIAGLVAIGVGTDSFLVPVGILFILIAMND